MISLFWSFFFIHLLGLSVDQQETIVSSNTAIVMDNCNLAISIPQDNCAQGLDFPLPISGISNIDLGNNVELTEARIIISHTWELDLRIYLRSPNGTRVPLSIENGTSASNTNYGDITSPDCLAYTAFTMDSCGANLNINDPSIQENFLGKYFPEGDFADFDGENPNGIWYLEICDKDAGANTGRLQYADLIFTELNCDAPQNVAVSSSNNSSITVSWDPIPNTNLTLIEVVPHGALPSNDATSSNGNIFQTNNSSSSTALELQEDTPYDVYVRTMCTNGKFSKNSCAVFVQTACETQAITIQDNFNSLPHCLPNCGDNCNITGLWKNVTYDDFDWSVRSGSTDANNSGPSGDVQGNGNYLYIKTNALACQYSKSAILESNCLQISANQNSCHMSFYYHMLGSSIGTLRLDILPQESSQWLTIWSQSGASENIWLRNYIDLRDYHGQNVKMRFLATGSTGNAGNIAIDDIVFYGAQPNGNPSFTHYRDRDNDGFGNNAEPLTLCSSFAPMGYVSNGSDCDDQNSSIFPGATEIGCNGIDENCNGDGDDSMVNTPSATFQTICSGEDNQVQVFGSDGLETQWFSDQAKTKFLGIGNPLMVDLASGFQTLYAQNVVRNGPGLRITEVNLNNPYHLEIQSIGKGGAYNDWKIYVNSVLDGGEINDHNKNPWFIPAMEASRIEVRSRSDWGSPLIWSNTRPGWVLLIDDKWNIQDAIFWNWSDTEMASINIDIDGHSYILSDIPWNRSAINVNQCNGSISLTGETENNSSQDYLCEGTSTIGEQNPDLEYEIVCMSSLVDIPLNVQQAPEVNFELDNDPCDNGSVSSGVELLIDDGVGPFDYSWSNGSIEQNQNNLQPGEYAVTITGGNGCHSVLDNINIGTSSSPIGLFTTDAQDVSCFGGEDGLVVVEVDGGAPPFQFNWIVGVARNDIYQNTDTLRGLAQGLYAVTVTDNNGCVSSLDFTVDEPIAISVNISTQLPTCQSSFDGFIDVETLGGNPPYLYAWSNGRTTETNVNLSFGEYTVTITDDNDCILVSDPIIFLSPTDTIALLDLQVQQIDCASIDNGSIQTSFGGGQGTLTYFWDNGAITPSIDNLEPGDYSLTVTDENLCEYYLQNVTIDQPSSAPIGLTFNTVEASCNGICDGVVSTNIVGGTPPYVYNWSTGDSTATVFDLCPGIVALTISDADGCQRIYDNEILINSAETNLQSQITVDSITCFNSKDGAINVSMSGGLPPYQYQWNSTTENTPNISDLVPGVYECTVTDNEGCLFYLESTSLLQPDIILLDNIEIEKAIIGTDNGSIEVALIGGRAPFEIVWFNAENIEVGEGPVLDNISIGNYAFRATDAGGCIFEKSNIVVELTNAVSESNLVNQFDIYPIPAKQVLNLDLSLSTTVDLELKIFNISGQLIHTEGWDHANQHYRVLNISNIPAGVYFATLWSDNKFFSRRNFIVE